MTEQLLAQQLESPSGTGRVEPRSDHQPDSPHQQATGYQQADPILTGSSALALGLPGGWRLQVEGPRRARRITARDVRIAGVLELVVEA